jgi:hypothetical protein
MTVKLWEKAFSQTTEKQESLESWSETQQQSWPKEIKTRRGSSYAQLLGTGDINVIWFGWQVPICMWDRMHCALLKGPGRTLIGACLYPSASMGS